MNDLDKAEAMIDSVRGLMAASDFRIVAKDLIALIRKQEAELVSAREANGMLLANCNELTSENERMARAESANSGTFPPRDTSKPAEQQGIFEKFTLRRNDGSDAPGGKHHGCSYFVLDLDHDQHAAAAMRAYAASCHATHPQLAVDIEARFPAQPGDGELPALSDEQIVGVLHSCGIDTYPSAHGFKELQVSATSLPWVREVIRRSIELLAARQPAPVEMPPPDADDYVSIELCDMYTHIGIDGKWYTFAELQAALAQRAGIGEAKPTKWLVSWGMGDQEVCDTERDAKNQKHLLDENGWQTVTVTPLYATPPAQPASERDAALRERLEKLPIAMVRANGFIREVVYRSDIIAAMAAQQGEKGGA